MWFHLYELSRIGKFIETKEMSICWRLRERRMGSNCLVGVQGFCLGWRKVLELDRGSGHTLSVLIAIGCSLYNGWFFCYVNFICIFFKAGFILGTHQLSLFLFEAFPQTGWTAENRHSACLDPLWQVILQETTLMSRKEEKGHFRASLSFQRWTYLGWSFSSLWKLDFV